MEASVEAEETFLAVSQDHSLLMFGGAHTDEAWCWCQPPVEYVPRGCGHDHPEVHHREFSDLPDTPEWLAD